jgi:hypothetical protein
MHVERYRDDKWQGNLKVSHKVSLIIGDGIDHRLRWVISITCAKRRVYVLTYHAMETYGECQV